MYAPDFGTSISMSCLTAVMIRYLTQEFSLHLGSEANLLSIQWVLRTLSAGWQGCEGNHLHQINAEVKKA
jgi:hypothetical protein